MVNNNFYVMLEKEWFYNSEDKKEEETLLQKYGTNSLMVYSVMLRNLTPRNTFSFSIDSLCSTLLINKKDNYKKVSEIKDAIRLLNDNLFTVCSDSNCNIAVDLSNIDNKNIYYCIRKGEPMKEKFIMVYDTEIDKMITYSKGKKNSLDQLITHYIFIANGFNNSEKDEGYKCYFGGMDYIEQKTGIENSTLLPNNKIFTSLQLLLIGNAGGTIEDDMYKNTSNIYARVENKIEFDKFMEIKKASLNKRFASKTDKEKQDKQRQLKQLINKWKKDNEIYEFDTKESLSEEQFNELHELEMKYFNLVKSRDKKPVNPRFLTIKQDGTIKEKYVPEDEIEEEYIEPIPKGKGLFGAGNKNLIGSKDKVRVIQIKSKSNIPYEDRPIIFNVDEDEFIDEEDEEHVEEDREYRSTGYNEYEKIWGSPVNF